MTRQPLNATEQLTTVIGMLEDTVERMRLLEGGVPPPEFVEPLRGFGPGFVQALFSDTIHIASEVIDGLGGLPLRYEDSKTRQQVHTVVRTILSYNPHQDMWTFATSPNGTPLSPGDGMIEVHCTTPEIRQNHEAALEASAAAPLHPRAV